jgi:hypothetical protein
MAGYGRVGSRPASRSLQGAGSSGKDEAEVERLRQLRSVPLGHNDHHRWLDYAAQRIATQSSMRERLRRQRSCT